ncbi:Metallo-dependent hydrolase [Cryphonectria parasitica EP155]|uniref:Metallo-dependent hydrolase n=1 Tax=Cryphonectria parasitica (strain ATCC 38755 / EP155) TaxID=660469 RepID=A0A9P4Y6X3_CRYP1|nr:Metallo-dependent hydrolase [Cryphonectria parasitica EP155]KAF3767836.1 Metallo-dependent hydrolase [Cryphonectria parasitica EP155]
MASVEEPFPWDLGIYDAHCHPTDTMATISSIAETMQARTLTVMATRSQDQELVAQLAGQYGVRSPEALASSSPQLERVIPAFGWHPWFSHQIYDDLTSSSADKDASNIPSPDDSEAVKWRHYNAVLVPSPESKDDEGFINDLPTPYPLSALLSRMRTHLEQHPLALVGEIGLDKAFRLPSHGPARDDGMTPGRRNGQSLSPYRVSMAHQILIFKAQLHLAGELGRAVSVHGVQAPGPLYETLRSTWKGHEKRVVSRRERKKIAEGVNEDFSSSSSGEEEEDAVRPRVRRRKPKPFPPRICLHSFSSGVQTLRQYVEDRSIPAKIFFSFSHLVNYSTGAHEHARKKHIADDVVRACPDDRILLESDLHTAGTEMDSMLEQIYRSACAAKGWDLRDGAERVKRNYEEFIIG